MDQLFAQTKLMLLLVSHIEETAVTCLLVTLMVYTELEFSETMTCDDVCDWLKQNNLSDEDILPFRSRLLKPITSYSAVKSCLYILQSKTLMVKPSLISHLKVTMSISYIMTSLWVLRQS